MHYAACLSDAEVARIAAVTCTDPRSVVRRLAGLPVRGEAGRRIDRELRSLETAPRASSEDDAAE